MVKGKIYITTILAFFEVLIWFIVAREALVTEMNCIFIPLAYSLGYATGTFIGTYISNNYIRGVISVEIIANKNQNNLIKKIKENKFAVSVIDLKDNKNGLILCKINNKRQQELLDIVNKFDSSAFIVVNETKFVHNGFIK